MNTITESIYKLVAVNDAAVYLLSPPLITKTCGLKQWRHIFECMIAGKTMTSEEIVKPFVNDPCLYYHQLQNIDTSLTNRVYVELIEQDWRVAGINPSIGIQLIDECMVYVYYGQIYKLIERFTSIDDFIKNYNEIVDPNNNAPQVGTEVLNIIKELNKQVNKPYEKYFSNIHCFGCNQSGVCLKNNTIIITENNNIKHVKGTCSTCGRLVMGFVSNDFQTTQLIDVKWNQENPIGIVNPIQINNNTVTLVSLKNLEELKQKGLKIGSTVTIKLVNHCVPYIDQIVTTKGQEIVKPMLKSTRSGKKY
jgi:hypothetical protein